MNSIVNKLRSKSGASMLIAIVFMMFCLFVGGAVLAAASANGYRVKHLSDQQDFLNQRSACQLLADEIDGAGTVKAKLTVSDIDIRYDPITVLANGSKVPDTSRSTILDHTITFSAQFTETNTMSAVQRIMYETAVLRYLAENEIDLGDSALTVKLEGFYYGPKVGEASNAFGLGDFWCKNSTGYVTEGSIDIYGIPAADGAASDSFTASFASGTGNRLYDFCIGFGAYTQMTVSANAYTSELSVGPITATENLTVNSVSGDWDVTKLSNRITISWDPAYIEKGGA